MKYGLRCIHPLFQIGLILVALEHLCCLKIGISDKRKDAVTRGQLLYSFMVQLPFQTVGSVLDFFILCFGSGFSRACLSPCDLFFFNEFNME